MHQLVHPHELEVAFVPDHVGGDQPGLGLQPSGLSLREGRRDKSIPQITARAAVPEVRRATHSIFMQPHFEGSKASEHCCCIGCGEPRQRPQHAGAVEVIALGGGQAAPSIVQGCMRRYCDLQLLGRCMCCIHGTLEQVQVPGQAAQAARGRALFFHDNFPDRGDS